MTKLNLREMAHEILVREPAKRQDAIQTIFNSVEDYYLKGKLDRETVHELFWEGISKIVTEVGASMASSIKHGDDFADDSDVKEPNNKEAKRHASKVAKILGKIGRDASLLDQVTIQISAGPGSMTVCKRIGDCTGPEVKSGITILAAKRDGMQRRINFFTALLAQHEKKFGKGNKTAKLRKSISEKDIREYNEKFHARLLAEVGEEE